MTGLLDINVNMSDSQKKCNNYNTQKWPGYTIQPLLIIKVLLMKEQSILIMYLRGDFKMSINHPCSVKAPYLVKIKELNEIVYKL